MPQLVSSTVDLAEMQIFQPTPFLSHHASKYCQYTDAKGRIIPPPNGKVEYRPPTNTQNKPALRENGGGSSSRFKEDADLEADARKPPRWDSWDSDARGLASVSIKSSIQSDGIRRMADEREAIFCRSLITEIVDRRSDP